MPWQQRPPPTILLCISLLLLAVAAAPLVTTEAAFVPPPAAARQQQHHHHHRHAAAAGGTSPDNNNDDDGASTSSTSTTMPLLDKLGPRLSAVWRLVPHDARALADIGCDHNLLGLALALDGDRHPMLQRVIGLDRAEGPLAVALKNLERHPQAAAREQEGVFVVGGRRVELRLGDGLAGLSRDDGVDTVCFAGMGTRNIVDVLSGAGNAAEVLGGVQHMVVQAYDPRPLFMHDLRAHLTTTLRHQQLGPGGRGFTIVDESIVKAEDRVFITLLARAVDHLSSSSSKEEEAKGDEPPAAAAAAAAPSFRRLLLGQHLGRRAQEDAETRAVYEEYLRHHQKWFAQLLAARAKGNSEKALGPAAEALAAIEQELGELGRF